NFEVIRELVAVLTAPGTGGPDRDVEVLTLTQSRATDVVELLGDLYVEEANRARGANVIRVTADERLNAVLVNAPPADVRAIRGLVAQLDGARPSSVVEIKYIPLASANALETVSLIENVLSGRGIGARRRSQQATVLKYLREIAREEGQEIPEGADGEIEEVQVSAAIRESISLTPDLRTNTVIVSAPAASIGMIERMIRDLDESTTGAQRVRIFKLQNADATAMAEILTELFNLRRGNNLYVLKPREPEREGLEGLAPGVAPPPAAAAISLGGTELTPVPDERQQLSITVDSRTNSLLVSGTPTYLDLVSQVVEELDALEANERETLVYPLNNAKALEVAQVLTGFVEEEQRKLVETLSLDQLGSASRLLEREVTIVGDEKSNTVLVSASPRYIEHVRRLIIELDVDPPQVLIQVLLAEVTLDDAYNWGVDLDFDFGAGSADVAGGYRLTTGAFSGVSSAIGGVIAANAPTVSVTTGDFELLIKALQAQGRLQILSNPSVMTANNQPARIQVGEEIRVPESTIVSDTGSQSTAVIEKEIGVIVDVTPSINPDGFVRMEITPEISELSSETTQISEDFESPIITKRNTNTTVTVRDGQTVVIGGLISDRYEERESKVPFLGDLPLVGALFRAESRALSKTEFLIVVTPYVLETPTSLDEITEREVDRLSVPPHIKEQIRRGLLRGTLYDADGNRIGLEEMKFDGDPTVEPED
ncbi:MAG: secretin N-terminal domain-containing protein, partial [Planctomycetota bacterium]